MAEGAARHFREQVDGDLVDDGVCGLLIAEKLGISQPTLSEHMKLLVQTGLVQLQAHQAVDFLQARRGTHRRDQEADLMSPCRNLGAA